jgi:hypothetical protein
MESYSLLINRYRNEIYFNRIVDMMTEVLYNEILTYKDISNALDLALCMAVDRAEKDATK